MKQTRAIRRMNAFQFNGGVRAARFVGRIFEAAGPQNCAQYTEPHLSDNKAHPSLSFIHVCSTKAKF